MAHKHMGEGPNCDIHTQAHIHFLHTVSHTYTLNRHEPRASLPAYIVALSLTQTHLCIYTHCVHKRPAASLKALRQ